MHTCCIVGEGGAHWPAPTFRVLASDRPDEPLDGKSPTGAWNAALSRINAEIEARYTSTASAVPSQQVLEAKRCQIVDVIGNLSACVFEHQGSVYALKGTLTQCRVSGPDATAGLALAQQGGMP